MHRFIALALAAFGLLPLRASAQDTNYAYYSVTDTGQVSAQIWASPVFEFHAPTYDMEALNRLAGEFHRHVAGLGGAGNKDCVALATRAEAEAFRQEQSAIWNKKMMFMKAGNWHDVVWTPPPLVPVAATAAPVMRYFRCYATTTDVPGYRDRAWTVSSGVFERPVPGDRALMAALEQSNAYQEEFGAVAQANGIPADKSTCMAYDTSAEAGKAEQDYRKLIGGFNTKYTVLAWRPSGKAGAPIAQEQTAAPKPVIGIRIGEVNIWAAKAMGLTPIRGAWVTEVISGSAAQSAGIKTGDVVLEIDGQAVAVPGDVPVIAARLRPGSEVPVRVWRESGPHDLTLVVLNGKSDAPVAQEQTVAPRPVIGIRIGEVNAMPAQAMGLSPARGAWVVEVMADGAAQKAGIKPMDVVLDIAGRAVAAPGDVMGILAGLESGIKVPVRVWREGGPHELTLIVPERTSPP